MQGLAYFPGIQQLVEASITLVHGISPSVAVLVLAPQADFAAQGGTLTFAFGNTQIEFPDCRVDSNSFERNGQSEIWRLAILDRRWKWAWGQISGSYNLREDDGTLRKSSEQTPQQLAALCLQAMGESGYDLGDLPNESRPAVEWDHDVPAAALAELCDQLGCRVVLQLDNTVALRQVGLGQELPTDGLLENSLAIDPPETPAKMAVVCGRDRYQADFALEAVGLDNDGTIKPIDQLSYAPSGGWSSIDLPYMLGLTVAGNSTAAARARDSVFKWYRIAVPATIPDVDGSLDSLERILPLEAGQVDTSTSTVNGQPVCRSKPAQVYGIWHTGNEGLQNGATVVDPTAFETNQSEYRRALRLDTRLGIVKFSEFVYRNTADSGSGTRPATLVKGAAKLRLRVACAVRDAQTLAPLRYERSRSYGGEFDTPTRYLRCDELVRTHVPVYDASFNVRSVTRNEADLDPFCDDYLDAAEQQYQLRLPQTMRYVGLRPLNPDGAIHQLTFSVGPRGATTTAARNSEQLHRVVTYRERRSQEQARALGQLAARSRPAAIRRENRFAG